MNILVIRFREMGDAIIATPLLASLRKSFPEALIDYVVNANIAPLFEGHPHISRLITFTADERHNTPLYLQKVWKTVHTTRYDIIIDLHSTFESMAFSVFSRASSWRIGLAKSYTRPVFTHVIPRCGDDESMIDHNLQFLRPLADNYTITYDKNVYLSVTEKEKQDFRTYMAQQGIDYSRPIMLAGVTGKIESKTWKQDRMIEILRRIMHRYPRLQIIFNYAPGREADNARAIFEQLDSPEQVFIDIQARSSRALAAMASNIDFYFGNEGGARHIVHAMGRPSFVICSPMAPKATWIPADSDVLARGIEAADLVSRSDLARMDALQRYDAITVEAVWQPLLAFCEQLSI